MKHIAETWFFLLFVSAGFLLMPAGEAIGAGQLNYQALNNLASASLKTNEVGFMFLGSSTVIIKVADQLILVDPADYFDAKALEALKPGGVNVVFYTHGHGDHFKLDEAVKLYERFKPFVICEPSIVAQFQQKIPDEKMISATPDKSFTAGKITVDAISGKHPGGIVLYRMTVEGVTLFHGGDSGYVPLGGYPSQLAFLPAGGASPTASPGDAVRMVSDLKPQTAVIFHGDDKQYAAFKSQISQAYPKIKVIVPKANALNKVTIEPAGPVPAE